MKRLFLPGLLIALLATTFNHVPAPAAPTGMNALGDVRVLFVGDIMVGRHVHELMAGNFERPFKYVTGFLQAPDLTVGNLEGPLVATAKIPRPVPNSFNLTGDTRAAKTLAKVGFDVLSVSNNHAFDAGASGLASTIEAVKSAGIGVIGADNTGKQTPVVKEVRGLKIAFLAFADFLNIPGTGVTYIRINNAGDRDRVAREIALARKSADIVVVFWHWGPEYAVQPSSGQKQMAQLSADAGADLVIGSHPHVAQGMELKSKSGRSSLVVYSLGNALFDQYFSQEVRQGLALECYVDKNGVKSARFIALENRKESTGYTMNVADDAVGQFAIQRAAKSTPAELQWKSLWSSQQVQPGLAIAYRRPDSAGRRTSLEKLGMADPSRVELYSNSLTVSKYIGPGAAGSSTRAAPTPRPQAQSEWLPVWSSTSGWRVTNYTVGDVDADGQPELIYTLWKQSLTWTRPPDGGMAVNMQGGELLPHIYVNGWRRGQMAPVWHGSPRPAPVLSVAVAPIGKNGKPLLAILESADKKVEKAPGKATLWQWASNFGFEQVTSVPGAYSTMWSDGKVLLFR
ncbi:MAG TPA: CapA family protein [Chloroflexia bacterium]|nr:CapA family protein [Chloroflexia bacterium]